MTSSEYYTTTFFEQLRNGATTSAEVMLPLVFEVIRVRSVADVGCGEGNWLRVCQSLGVEDVFGIDGDYVERDRLQIPESQFQVFDLTKPFRLGRVFDLAISLEVAEHLPADCAPNFVECLTRLAPLILFSAAIPFQGGNHHLNEQWPDRWAALFQEHGYVPIDFIREQVWQNDKVGFWYAQNTLLFARSDLIEGDTLLKAKFERTNLSQLCLVHPKQYLYLQNQYMEVLARPQYPPPPSGVIEASHLLLLCLKNSLRKRLGLQ